MANFIPPAPTDIKQQEFVPPSPDDIQQQASGEEFTPPAPTDVQSNIWSDLYNYVAPQGSVQRDLVNATGHVIGEGVDYVNNRVEELNNSPVDTTRLYDPTQLQKQENSTEGFMHAIATGAAETIPMALGVGEGGIVGLAGLANKAGAAITGQQGPSFSSIAQDALDSGRKMYEIADKPIQAVESLIPPESPEGAHVQQILGNAFEALPNAYSQVFKDHGASQLVQDYVKLITEGAEVVGPGMLGKAAGILKAKPEADIQKPLEKSSGENNSSGGEFNQWLQDNGKELSGDPEKDIDLINEWENQAAPRQQQPQVKPRIKLKLPSTEDVTKQTLSPDALDSVTQHVTNLDTGSVPTDLVVQHVTKNGGDINQSIWEQFGPKAVTKFARNISRNKAIQNLAVKGDADALNTAIQKNADTFLSRMQQQAQAKPELFNHPTVLRTAGTGKDTPEWMALGSINTKALNAFEQKSLQNSIDRGETSEMLRMHPELQRTVIKDPDGNLIPIYHGTQSEALYTKHDPNAGFKQQGFTSYTLDPTFAESATDFTSHPENKQIKNPRVQRGFLNLQTPWDFKNPKDIDRLLEHDPYLDYIFTNGSDAFTEKFAGKNNELFYFSQAKRKSAQFGTSLLSELSKTPLQGHIYELRQALSDGRWIPIEEAKDFIQALGHDSFTTMEGGAYNIHVFDPAIAFIPNSVTFLKTGETKYAQPEIKFLMTASIKDPLKRALLGAAYKANGITPKARLDLNAKVNKASAFNAMKFTDYETRPGKEILDSLFTTDEVGTKVPTEKDIGEAKSDSLFGHMSSIIRSGANLFKQGPYLGDAGTIVRKVVDGADLMDKARNRLASNVIHGEGFSKKKLGVTGLRMARRAETPGSMFYTVHRTKDAKVREIMDFMQENNGVKDYTAKELADKGFEPRQIMIYKEIREGLNKAVDHYNEFAESVGMKPIQKTPGFLPAMWEGNWRIWGTNPDGVRDRVYSSPNFLLAHNVRSTLAKQFPDYKWEVVPAKTGKYDIMAPTEAFLAAHTLFSPGSALHKAMDIAVDEVFKRQGFRSHSMQRRGVSGSLGTYEEGKTLSGHDKRMTNMLHALESYVEQSFRYTEMRRYMKDIMPLLTDADTAKAYRNQVKIANLYLRAVTGEDTWINATADKALRSVFGLTSNFLITTKLLFYNAGFLASQLFSSMNVLPRLALLQSMHFKDASVGKALLHGLVDSFLPDKNLQAFIQDAQAQGILEPKFVESLSWIFSKRGGPAKATYQLLSGSWVANKLDSFTRLHSLMTFYRFFESAGIEKTKAMRMARKQTDLVMVPYERFKRMPIFNALGPIGDAFAPLTTFMSNDLNSLALYSMEAIKGVKGANPKAFLPLLYKLGIYTSVAGMLGLPGWQDIDKLVGLINKTFRTDIATPTEKLLQSGWSDALIFGIPSVFTNMDISGVAGGPSLSLFGSMAGLSNAWETIKAIGAVGRDELDRVFGLGTGPTKKEWEKAWQSVLPKTWDYMLTNPKGTTTKSGALDYQYGKQDVIPGTNIPAQALGAKSIPQSKYQKGMQALKQHEANQQNIREYSLQKFMDSVVNGSLSNQDVQSFVNNYSRRGGGDLSKLDSTLTKQLQQRMLNRVQQMIIQGNSINGALNIEQMKKLNLLEQQIGQLNPVEIGQLGKMLNSGP